MLRQANLSFCRHAHQLYLVADSASNPWTPRYKGTNSPSRVIGIIPSWNMIPRVLKLLTAITASNNPFLWGSGCGSVGTAVSFWHKRSVVRIQQIFKRTFVYCPVNCIKKTKIKKNSPRLAHLKCNPFLSCINFHWDWKQMALIQNIYIKVLPTPMVAFKPRKVTFWQLNKNRPI